MKRIATILTMVAVCGATAFAADIELPPSDDTATAALEASPRHMEIVTLPIPELDTEIQTYLIYPERSTKAPVVVVIHEIFGITDWVKSVGDHLAKQGFIALVPDLISDVEGDMNAMGKVRSLKAEDVAIKLNAVRAHGLSLPAANGKTGSVGFCWGGSTSFMYATAQPGLGAAVVFYGSSPDAAALANVNAPVLGHYGEMDARVNVTIPDAEAELDRLGKSFEHGIYDNAGHGFLRAQGGRDGSNLGASEQAWPRTVEFFREHLELPE